MNKASNIIENTFLSKDQLFYFNLFVLGYNDTTIFEILDIDEKGGALIKQQVKDILGRKYDTIYWQEIIKESFKDGLLNKYDHLNPIVKNQANIYAKQIFAELFIDKVSFYDSTEPIKHKISNFLNSCSLLLKKQGENK